MRKFLKTTLDFTKKVGTTGAMFETSPYVVAAITESVNSTKKQVIAEFGAGHGNITKGILARMHHNSVLLSFELHREFCDVLHQNVQDPRVHIINDSASELPRYLKEMGIEQLDIIISAIPITILPKSLTEQIMSDGKRLLQNDGAFMQVLYSLRALSQFRQHFPNVTYRSVWRNLPPAWIYTCKK